MEASIEIQQPHTEYSPIASRRLNVNPMRIDFKNVSFSISTGWGSKTKDTTILRGVSGALLPGTMTAIMGPSGSGFFKIL